MKKRVRNYLKKSALKKKNTNYFPLRANENKGRLVKNRERKKKREEF